MYDKKWLLIRYAPFYWITACGMFAVFIGFDIASNFYWVPDLTTLSFCVFGYIQAKKLQEHDKMLRHTLAELQMVHGMITQLDDNSNV